MKNSVVRRKTCRLCGRGDLEPVLPLVPTPSGDAYVTAERLHETQEVYPLEIVLCRCCGYSQLHDVVDPMILYVKHYLYTTSISLGLSEHFRNYVEETLHRVKPAPGVLVIDIGSNDGTLLQFFKNQGMRVLGVDPAVDVAKEATETGVETIPYFFTAELARKIKRTRGPAAIVTANNVFANVDDVTDMVMGIRELLTPDGVFTFETFYLVDVLQKTLLETIFHEHLSYFTVKPLEAFFRRSGMELIECQRVPPKGGSLRGTVQLAGGPRRVSPSVAELIALETVLGVHQPAPFRAFAAKTMSVKNQLLSLLRDLKDQGKTIAGFGASVGVTTLVYQFDLAALLSFLVDDNPSRHHLFSPAHHIPVLPPSILLERKPDYVLILAWMYAQPIIAKHQAYLKQGGHFIVPLPNVEVIAYDHVTS